MPSNDAPAHARALARIQGSPSEEEQARRQRVVDALLEEGFEFEVWQKPEKGMVFGMVRREGEDGKMQLHVRYYRGGCLKAEREIAHVYIEHLISPRESAHDEVEAIMAEHDLLDDVEVAEKAFPKRMQGEMPSSRTPWKPLVLGVGAVLAGAVFAGRSLLRGPRP